MQNLFFSLIIITIFCSGCASTGKSIALSSATGAAVGAANGAVLFPVNTKKGVLKGALIGSVAGGILGWLTHGWFEKRDAKIRRDTILGLNRSDVLNTPWNTDTTPAITKPIIEGRWVEPKVEGKKLIEGHKEWKISEESQWVFPQEMERTKETENEK